MQEVYLIVLLRKLSVPCYLPLLATSSGRRKSIYDWNFLYSWDIRSNISNINILNVTLRCLQKLYPTQLFLVKRFLFESAKSNRFTNACISTSSLADDLARQIIANRIEERATNKLEDRHIDTSHNKTAAIADLFLYAFGDPCWVITALQPMC